MLRHLLILFTATACSALAANQVPLVFIPNHGQAHADVQFMVKGSGLTAFFGSREARFRVGDAAVRLRFVGARASAEAEGLGVLPGTANFLIGPETEWRRGVPLYGGVIYRELYPGIDMIYGGNGRDLKSEFVVAPGADPASIRLRYQGSGKVRIADDGALVIPVSGRELREQAPTIYQERDGVRTPVEGHFALAGGVVSFIVNGYDAALPLVIDPVLSYNTLLGGAGSDASMALAVDATGSAYVAGFTASYDFPTANPEQNFNAGANDAFIAKLTPAGNGLVYCTYVGGRGDDRAYAIAVDASGAAYVAGSTTSTNFPARSALQGRLGGAKNAFVAKLNPAGNTLLFSTYLGGTGSDVANGIALDGSGNPYITGDTTSPNFPVSGGLQKNSHGSQDAFVAKLSSDGSRLVYSTFLGGSADDHGAAIAVDSGGSAYVTGSTYSSDFPVAAAYQGTLGGGQDAFVARISADGGSLVFSTFLGGVGGMLGYPESGQAIALDAQGNAYVAGVTPSPNFPLLNPLQSALRGSGDAFVSKLTSAGALVYSTFLGGTGVDMANAIAVDSSGNAYVAGQTFSADLPVTAAFQPAYGGDYDAFVAKLSATDTLLFLSYLGGSGAETATAAALDPAANLYVAGWTLSPNFPVVNGYQSVNAGNYGGFVGKLSFGGTLPTVVGVTPNTGTGASQTFSLQFSDTAGASNLTSVALVINSSQSTAGACSATYTQAGGTLMLLTDAGTTPASGITPGSGSQQNSQCVLNGAGSSVSLAGNVLTLNLAITFQAGFTGNKNIYLQAVNPSGTSGWQLAGTWALALGPPAPVSVTPASGSGSSQTFTLTFSSPKGYSALASVSAVFNATLSGYRGCFVAYYPGTSSLYLSNDTSAAWLGPGIPGQSGSLQNSQCTVNLAASSASGSGTNLTLNLALSFQPAFGGAKSLYMDAYDGTDSGWQLMGTWTVPTASPAPVSVTPNSGSGSSQTFTFVFSSPKEYTALISVSAVINGSLSGYQGCFLTYYPGSGALYLSNDTSTVWLGPAVLGQGSSLQNSQCSVNPAASSASGSGTNLTLNLALSFQAAFTGTRNVYMEAYDGIDSGWQSKGTWTIPAPPPGPVSVTPNSGSGASQNFTLTYSSPKGYAALSSVSAVINGTLSGYAGCFVVYYPHTNALYLSNDTSSVWLGPATLGQGSSLQNSQCTVNPAASSATGSGSNLTLNLVLSFQPAFTGAKKVYMEAYDGTDSGWQQKGSWTIP